MPDESDDNWLRGPIAILAGLTTLWIATCVTVPILVSWQDGTNFRMVVACVVGAALSLLSGACATAGVSAAIAAVEQAATATPTAPRYFSNLSPAGYRRLVTVWGVICGAALIRLAKSIYAARFEIPLPFELVSTLALGPLLLAALAGVAKLWKSPRTLVQVAPDHRKWCFWLGMFMLLLMNLAFFAADFHGSQDPQERNICIAYILAALALGGSHWLLLRAAGCSRRRTARYLPLNLLIVVMISIAQPRF